MVNKKRNTEVNLWDRLTFIEGSSPSQDTQPAKDKNEKKKKSKMFFKLANIVGAVVWLYAIVNSFFTQ